MKAWSPLWLLLVALDTATAVDHLYLNAEESSVIEHTKDVDFRESASAKVVEFYSPHCGACQAFKPKYIKFAKAFQEEHPDVQFYAVSCIAHREICSSNSLRGYPTLKAFPADSDDGVYIQRKGTGLGFSPDAVAKLLGLEVADSTEDEQDNKEGGAKNDNENNDGTGGEEDEGDDEDNEEDDEDTPDEGNSQIEEDIDESPKSGVINTSTPLGRAFEGMVQAAEKAKQLNAEAMATDGRSNDSAEIASRSKNPVVRAGAVRAGFRDKDMDKWREFLEKKRQEFDAKNKHKTMFRPGGGAAREARRMREPSLERAGDPGATPMMKAYKPGTREFDERRQQLIERIQKSGKTGAFRVGRHRTNIQDLQNMDRLPIRIQPRQPGFVRKQAEKLPVLSKMLKLSPTEALILDVSLSFVQSLKNGFGLKTKPLSSGEKQSLIDWFDLLSVSLPQEWGLHSTIDMLKSNIEKIASAPGGNMVLENLLEKHPMPRRVWSKSCDKLGIGGGFTCGLWKLLHVVTIGVAEHRGGLNLGDTHKRAFSPAGAAEVIRNYLRNFFTCKPCLDHFMEIYDKCAFRRCDRLSQETNEASDDDWKQLALWLWEVHNDVNVRVLKDKITSDTENVQSKTLLTDVKAPIISKSREIEAIYPDIENCLPCLDGSTGLWHENSVFAFLEKTYWGLPDAKEKLIVLDKSGGQDGTAGGLIWILLIGAIATVYFLRGHLRVQSAVYKLSLPSVNIGGVKQKLGDAIGGKKRTA